MGELDDGHGTVEPEAWQRLAHAIRERRIELHLSARRAAQIAGVARNTWIAVEDGRHPAATTTLAKVEAALRWCPGGADVALVGGEPAVLPPGAPSASVIFVDNPDDAAATILAAMQTVQASSASTEAKAKAIFELMDLHRQVRDRAEREGADESGDGRRTA